MSTPHRWYSTTLTVFLMIVAWVLFGPIQLGGNTGYVIINGNSMEPGLYRGDLVVIRNAPSYSVGEVVTCQHPGVGHVIHRIIAREGYRFVTQGDNNDFIDPYKPSQQDCVGTYWFHLPRVGNVLVQYRFSLLLVGALSVVWLARPQRNDQQAKRRRPDGRARRKVPPMTAHVQKPRIHASLVSVAENVLSVGIILIVLLGATAAFVFTRPLTRETREELTYQHTGRWTYTPETASDIYDVGQVQPGDPIFRKLTDKVRVQFDYALSSDERTDMVGVASLYAEIRNDTGWKRTFLLQPERAFRGNATTVAGTLDLAAVQEAVDTFATRTGITTRDYTLSLVPRITIRGTVAGQRLDSTFSPRLPFRYSELGLRTDMGDADAKQLKPSEAQTLEGSRTEANTISWLRWSIDVSDVRRWLVIALASVVLMLVTAGMLYARLPRPDGDARIEAQHKSLMIEVQTHQEEGVVDVANIADLVRLAEREGRMIFHEKRAGSETYWMNDLGVTYRYIRAKSPASTEQPTESRVVAEA